MKRFKTPLLILAILFLSGYTIWSFQSFNSGKDLGGIQIAVISLFITTIIGSLVFAPLFLIGKFSNKNKEVKDFDKKTSSYVPWGLIILLIGWFVNNYSSALGVSYAVISNVVWPIIKFGLLFVLAAWLVAQFIKLVIHFLGGGE